MGARCIQLTALLLCNLAAVSLGLGIANVIATYFFVYNVSSYSQSCQPGLSNTANCPYRNVVTLAFIGSGIWGSLVVFAVGILAIKSIAKQFAYRSMFLTATFVTAVVVIPTMVVLNAVNAALVTNENAPSVLFNTTLGDANPVSAKVLFALPITVSCVSFLEMLVMAGMLVYTCMCFKQQPESKEPTAEVPKPAQTQPQPQSQTQPAVQPSTVAPEPDVPAGFYPYPGPRPMAYSPYGPAPYRRPIAYAGTDYGRLDPTSIYRPALRTPYMYPPSAARYPMARPYPLSYVPPGY